MEKFFSLFTIAIAALGMTSCFEHKIVVSINKDGTGTIVETLVVDPQSKTLLDSLGVDEGDRRTIDPFKDMLPDKAEAEERAQTLGSGVRLKSHEEITMQDGRVGVKDVYAVTDITKLQYSPGAGPDTGKLMTFARSGNTLTITYPEQEKEEAPRPEVSKEKMKAQIDMTRTMMAGLRITFEVKVPGGIASTDASHATADTITMMNVDFDKAAKKDANLIALLDSQYMTAAETAAKLKDVNGFKVEARETFKVEMK
jgi:hypothetical protein